MNIDSEDIGPLALAGSHLYVPLLGWIFMTHAPLGIYQNIAFEKTHFNSFGRLGLHAILDGN